MSAAGKSIAMGPRRSSEEAAARAYVRGDEAPLPTLDDGAAGRRVLVRRDGRHVQRLNMLVPAELARRVNVYAATRGLDKTQVATAALDAWLSERGA